MKAKRLRWSISYDPKHDWLRIELQRGRGPFFNLVWECVASHICFRFSEKHDPRLAKGVIRVFKKELLMSFIKNTATEKLLNEIIEAENDMVTAQELKDAANALRSVEHEAAG